MITRVEGLLGPICELDLSGYTEVCIECNEHFVKTTPEHFVDCMSWLLSSVDTDTLITKEGVEPDDLD